MSTTPIADYAILSDRHSAALVSHHGSLDWLCSPRFDSPSIFARLLDDNAGHWSIRPSGWFETSRRYLDQTMVLETTFHTGSGTVVLTDAFALGHDNAGHRLGADVPHLVIRRLHCTQGSVPIHIAYHPRPEYGLINPILTETTSGVTARTGARLLVLTTPVRLDIGHDGAVADVTIDAGTTLYFGLHCSTLEQPPARVWEQAELADRLDSTIAAWRSWSDLHQAYVGPWHHHVHHSGRVLQALTFQPTGAIVAAATTSLPEAEGGERNWDYRYSWVRDASLTLEALWVAACPDEANDFFAFLTAAAPSLSTEKWLPIMFGVGGERDLSERTLPHLRGWRGSRPVRIGNGAWDQRQIDVYGEILCAADRLADYLTGIDDETRRFLVDCADAAAERWRETDHGIWEVRSAPKHFLHSKVMCWAALDRALALGPLLGAADRVDTWRRTRDEIRRTILRDGWNDEVGAFTQYFGSRELDASALTLPIVRFLPADDPRMLKTIDAISERLTDDQGLVHRYHTQGGVDGLAGEEGTFLMCTFWLAHTLALSGQIDRAHAVFERAAAHANDVGLLAEEVDPVSHELLGNFPQAFSHIGLINAAWEISQAENAAATNEPR